MRWNKRQLLLVLSWLSPLYGADVVELSPYVVEAWHFDTLGLKVAGDVVRLESEVIAASQLTGVPEVLTELAGVRFSGFTGSGAEGQVALRGFGDNSGLRVLVLVDGLEYNPPDMGGINWQGMDVNELETVEVIRGGQSVLYGNHAVSGVIKLRTRQVGERPEGSVWMSGGSNATRQGSIGLGIPVRGMGVRGSFHYLETDGYRENSASKSHGGSLSWKSAPGRAGKWNGRIQADSLSTHFPGSLTYQQAREDPRQSRNAGNEVSDTDSIIAAVNGSGAAFGGDWETQAGFLMRDREWSLSGTHSPSLHRRLTLSPRVRLPLLRGSIILGTDLASDWLETSEYLGDERAIKRGHADLERLTVGAYGFGRWALPDGWEISGGLRGERADTDNHYIRYKEEQLRPELVTNRGTVPNPSYKSPPDPDPLLSFDGPVGKSGWAAELSLVKVLAQTVSIWGGWDRVYRYPSLDETASFQGYPLSNPLNTELAPETGDNFEIGIKRSGNGWSSAATAFLMFLDDEIAYYEDEEGIKLNTNIGDTRRYGVEMDGAWQAEKFGLSGRLSWTRAGFSGRDYRDFGDRLPLVPEWHATVTAWVSLSSALRLSAHWQYLSDMIQGNDFLNTGRKVPGYALVNVSLLWSLRENLSLSVRVYNLADKTHMATAYSGGFYPGSGRAVRLGMRATF